jgi:hypothetical protein
MSLPLTYDRAVLKKAVALMKAYAGEGYRVDLLPLYPLDKEIQYWLLGRRATIRDEQEVSSVDSRKTTPDITMNRAEQISVEEAAEKEIVQAFQEKSSEREAPTTEKNVRKREERGYTEIVTQTQLDRPLSEKAKNLYDQLMKKSPSYTLSYGRSSQEDIVNLMEENIPGLETLISELAQSKDSESEPIYSLGQEYFRITQPEGGVKSLDQLAIIQSQLQNLKQRIDLTNKPKSTSGSNSLNELRKVVDARLSEIASFQYQQQFVEPLFKEYERIMQTAAKGINSLDQLAAIESDLRSLKKRIGLLKNIESEPVETPLNDLTEAIDARLSDIASIQNQQQYQQQVVEPFFKEYERIMQTAVSGIKSLNQLDTIESDLWSLKKRIGLLKNTESEPVETPLNDLRKAIDARLGEIASIKDNVQKQEYERQIVEPLINEFKETMESLNKNGIQNREGLIRARDHFQKMKSNADAALIRISSQDAKNAINQLIAAIDNILRQLRI